MSALRVATTINPRFDHVTPIEATRSAVTITHRCHVFAELMAVARSGLVDIVLIADDFDMVGLESLRHLLDDESSGLKVAAISDVVDDRQRLSALGIPVASPRLSGQELVEWLEQVGRSEATPQQENQAFSAADLEVLEQLDPPEAHRLSGRRAGSYDSTRDTSVANAALSETPETSDVESALAEDAAAPSTVEDRVEAHSAQDVEAEESRGHLIAVWGPIGSPGVTTLAVNMAVESALAGYRTLLIDANTYGAAVAVHLGLLDDTAAIAQACRAAERSRLRVEELAAYTQRVTILGAGLDVMTGLTRPERWPQLRAAAWETILETARGGWDEIIIDCAFGLEQDEELSFDIPAPQRNATTLSAVTVADTVVAVGTGDPVGFARFMKGVDQLLETTTRPVVTVVNKVTSQTSGLNPKRQLETVWDRFGPKLPLQHFLPWAHEVVSSALFEAKTLAERAPKAELRRSIVQLLESSVQTTLPARTQRQTIAAHSKASTGVLSTVIRKMKEGRTDRK